MLSHHFQLLKKLVLTVSNLSYVAPSDCKKLSELIFQKTRLKLSETTLKRVYGFANSEFKPSQFTIDTLLQYCGYYTWTSFLKDHDQRVESDKGLNWLTLTDQADKITGFTLRALKGRSGIPYIKTVGRKFINDHMDDFAASGAVATALIAPAAYGKTIAVLHWIEEKQELGEVNGTNDIVLFFSTSTLQSALMSGQDIHIWLLSLLGFNRADNMVALLNNRSNDDGKFYLIIDGFDEHTLKNDQFSLIINHITDILSLYDQHSCLRLLITMRTSTWVNNRHQLDKSGKWFTGFNGDNSYINVPRFTLPEIKDIGLKINHQPKSFVHPAIIELVCNPLYLQLYYRLRKDDFFLNYADSLLKYDLVSAYMLEKIYMDKHSAERMMFLFELVQIMNHKNGEYYVNKLNASQVIAKHQNVYHELISQGFLREINKSEEMVYHTYIEFGGDELLEYVVAQKLLTDNNNRLNAELVVQINLVMNNEVKLNVIKWIIIYAVKTESHYNLSYITKTDLSLNQRKALLCFMGDFFDRELSGNGLQVINRQFFKLNADGQFFYYFLGLENIDSGYEKTLHVLLKFDLPDDKRLLVLISLAITAMFKLDLKALENYLLQLKKISQSELFKFPVNPLKCIDTVFHYLKYGMIKKGAFVEITKFCFNPPGQGEWFNDHIANDIMFTLAAFTVQFSRNPGKQLRFINTLRCSYKNFSKYAAGYTFFLNIVIADACFMRNDKNGFVGCYRSISRLANHHDHAFTPLMQALLHAYKIEMALIDNNYDQVMMEYKYFDDIAHTNKYKLVKLYIVTLLLKKSDITGMMEYAQFYKQLHYEHTRLIIEGAVIELFEKQVM
ncbi:hypothetical protein [Mucilaginibacter dorajii]|uniref:NACHT domain-containing protein n=1 Tax=Mucilaginibacter dorajii TaxID=692994 RepID=A0ABP7P4G0_9SPHI|nr:hypothetical protein [Mucilaginibacter dorajii]MCS3734426.1 hypothetical protein [Mucilaginibacter dorajii]